MKSVTSFFSKLRPKQFSVADRAFLAYNSMDYEEMVDLVKDMSPT